MALHDLVQKTGFTQTTRTVHMPRGRWWTAYFYFALTLTAIGSIFTTYFFDDIDANWHDLAFIPMYALQIVGLYGFVYVRRMGNAKLWQTFFVIALAYEALTILETYTYADSLQTSSFTAVFEAAFYGLYLLEVPMWIGLFIYAFKSKPLWSPAPNPSLNH